MRWFFVIVAVTVGAAISPAVGQTSEAVARCRAQPRPFQADCFEAIRPKGAPMELRPTQQTTVPTPPARREPAAPPRSAPPKAEPAVAQPQSPKGLRLEELERAGGYQPIGFEDFLLDGKKLGAISKKLSMRGYYLKLGNIEYLFPSRMAVLTAQNSFNYSAAIGILTEDADRDLRKMFLLCQTNPALSRIGCPVHLVGQASMCTKRTLVGPDSIACFDVEDGEGLGQ